MDEKKENLGGGSGGGLGPVHRVDAGGLYQIQANVVELVGRPPLPPAIPLPCRITLMAAGEEPTDGQVQVRGAMGVRITSGPIADPPTNSESTNGVEIIVSEDQMITIQRGTLPTDQSIVMTPGGITVNAGDAPLTLTSLSEITLSVAEGASTISLTPEGITIQGVLVQIN
jgi:hypothetical protein